MSIVLTVNESQPAAAHVFAATPAVGEDVGVVAAGVFESIGKDRQAVEGCAPNANRP